MPRIVRTAAALALLAGNADLDATQGGSADLRLATLEEPMSIEVVALGNPEFSNEHLVNTEAGYRFNPGSVWSLDVVGFSGRYDDLQTYEPLAPALQIDAGVPQIKMLTRYENLMRADTRGAEVASRVQLRDGWQVDGAFSAFHLTSHANGSQDPLFARRVVADRTAVSRGQRSEPAEWNALGVPRPRDQHAGHARSAKRRVTSALAFLTCDIH